MPQDNPPKFPKVFRPNRTEQPAATYTAPSAPPKPAPSKEPRIPFVNWFNEAMTRYPKMKPLHMHAVRAYFMSKGLKDPDTFARYEAMLKVYGL